MTHLAEKKSKAGESIPRVKTIYGLASKDDGHGLDHPPLVRSFGAGPKDCRVLAALLPMAPGKMPPRAAGTSVSTNSSEAVFAPQLLPSMPL